MMPQMKEANAWEDAQAPREPGMYWVQYFHKLGGMDGRAEIVDIDPVNEPGWARYAGGYAWTEAIRGCRPKPYAIYEWQRLNLRSRPALGEKERAFVRANMDMMPVDMARMLGCHGDTVKRLKTRLRAEELR